MDASVNQFVDQGVSLNVWLSDQGVFFNRLRNRDIEAFKILYKQYAPAIYGVIVRKITDEERAKLILDQTFCELWHHFSDYDATKLRIFSWMSQIAIKCIRETTV